jgi:hypothetical protein
VPKDTFFLSHHPSIFIIRYHHHAIKCEFVRKRNKNTKEEEEEEEAGNVIVVVVVVVVTSSLSPISALHIRFVYLGPLFII